METVGKVYEIVCNQTGERYIGSTTNMDKRKSNHVTKGNKCSSKAIIERNDFKINILENNIPLIPKALLRQKEQIWKNNLTCVNVNNAYISREEVLAKARKTQIEWYNNPVNKALKKVRYQENKEAYQAKSNDYYKQNKELRKIYVEANKLKIQAYQEKYRNKNKALKKSIVDL